MKKLAEYAKKRDFRVTPEPRGRVKPKVGHSFVIQKHDATRLHYDFRLELDGVLKSWAVPKGPSLSPDDKRLAVEVEDHPFDYRDFEGSIPEGQYGGGDVIVWDRGTWTPIGDPHAGLKKGHLRFTLDGEKLAGGWSLIRIRGRDREKRTNWLLVKSKDEHQRDDVDITEEQPQSVLTGRTLEDLADIPEPPKSETRRKLATKKAKRGAAKTAKKSTTRKSTAEKGAAQRARMPAIEPELATLVDRVPKGSGWVFEIKLDGYRTMGVIQGGEARMISRGGLDWTDRFPHIAEALSRIRVKDAIVDGEVVAMDEQGRTSFQRLQTALSEKDPSKLVYVAFDLLYRDGEDLRDRTLLERKELLATILAGEDAPLALSRHSEEDGEALLEEARKHHLEGIVAKRADAPYAAGRSKQWLKIKVEQRDELVIVGYTPQKGKKSGLGALFLATRDMKKSRTKGGALRYVCKVGTGFDAPMRGELLRRLAPLARATPPVDDAPRARDAIWVEPELVCEIRFTNWTKDGALRHPAFLGLREDKAAEEVVRERPVKAPTKGETKAAKRESERRTRETKPAKRETKKRETARTEGETKPAKRETEPAKRDAKRARDREAPNVFRGVTITNADRVIDETSGATKGELAAYYDEVAEQIMPYAKKRPLSLVRCPTGRGKKCFFQKHPMPGMGEHVESAHVDDKQVLFVSDPRGLIELVQFGVIELHAWGARLPLAKKPDCIVIDLDPDEGLAYGRVIEAALAARDLCASIGLETWVKTTGGKGLHVVAPFEPRFGWDVVKGLARSIAESMEQRAPDAFTSTVSKSARRGKIYVDYLRNGEGATAVVPYSARARENLTVAMPIAWNDLRRVHPSDFTIRTVPGLLAKRRRDPWADLLASKQTLPPGLDELIERTRGGR